MAIAPFDLSDNLIAQLGLENASDERKQELMSQATELVQKRVTLRILETLTDEQAAHAETLADDPEKLWAYFAESVPNIGELMQDEIESVRAQLIIETNPQNA